MKDDKGGASPTNTNSPEEQNANLLHLADQMLHKCNFIESITMVANFRVQYLNNQQCNASSFCSYSLVETKREGVY